MSALPEDQTLVGQLLIAMPQMEDDSFQKTIVYVCAHNSDGALGLVLNRPILHATFSDLLSQLDLPTQNTTDEISILSGGPVEKNRGFILHSTDYMTENSMEINTETALTATVEILEDIANGTGPKRFILALGYAGWGPEQLDSEILRNGWLHVAPSTELLFSDTDIDLKWEHALAELGIRPDALSGDYGSA